MTAYTTTGSVRGACGHAHRTLWGAIKCQQADHRGCAKQGGYSDRTIRKVIPAAGGRHAEELDLTDAEREMIATLKENR